MPPRRSFACALLATGCATAGAAPSALVDNLAYTAAGPPGWNLEIDDNDILLRLNHHFFGGNVAYPGYRYPARRPIRLRGVRRWSSGTGHSTILVEARSGPCRGVDARLYEDRVRVRMGRHDLAGCGGALLTEEGR